MSPLLNSAYKIFVKSIDKGILEFLGPIGLSRFFFYASHKASVFQSGLIYHYAFIFLIGLMFILTTVAFNFF